MPGAWPIACAIGVVAEKGTPLLDSQRSARLARIETPWRPGGVDNQPQAGPATVQIDLIPVAAPLPDVAGHVVQAIAVWRKRLDGRGAHVAVGRRVLVRKLALP